jgi:hypothetical protein
MRRMLMSLLGVAGLLAALAPPAVAQECDTDWVWHSDGKRYWRTQEYVQPEDTFPTMNVVVAAGERKEGDFRGVRYVGKQTERVYLREVPRPAPALPTGHECAWRFRYVGKTTTREWFCREHAVEQPYAHHAQPPEHTVKK